MRAKGKPGLLRLFTGHRAAQLQMPPSLPWGHLHDKAPPSPLPGAESGILVDNSLVRVEDLRICSITIQPLLSKQWSLLAIACLFVDTHPLPSAGSGWVQRILLMMQVAWVRLCVRGIRLHLRTSGFDEGKRRPPTFSLTHRWTTWRATLRIEPTWIEDEHLSFRRRGSRNFATLKQNYNLGWCKNSWRIRQRNGPLMYGIRMVGLIAEGTGRFKVNEDKQKLPHEVLEFGSIKSHMGVSWRNRFTNGCSRLWNALIGCRWPYDSGLPSLQFIGQLTEKYYILF